MHKFFVDESQIDEDEIVIMGQDVKHIKDVLRLSIGDEIKISSAGMNYISEIRDMCNTRVFCDVIETEEGSSESKIDITLYQGFAKGSKMDFILQKCTEVGVKEFVIVEMERCVVRSKDDKWKKTRIERFNAITEEAAKQCKRDIIPEVKSIISFKEMVNILKDEEEVIIPYEAEGDNNIGKILKNVKSDKINIVIGPEGGFADEEISTLKEIGGKSVSLGSRILRTETAGIVTSTIVLYELGNMGVI